MCVCVVFRPYAYAVRTHRRVVSRATLIYLVVRVTTASVTGAQRRESQVFRVVEARFIFMFFFVQLVAPTKKTSFSPLVS